MCVYHLNNQAKITASYSKLSLMQPTDSLSIISQTFLKQCQIIQLIPSPWDQQMQTIIYTMGKLQGPTIYHRKLYLMFCDKPQWKRILMHVYIQRYIYIYVYICIYIYMLYQRMRQLDGIIDSRGTTNLSKLWEIVKDREASFVAVHGVTKSWTQLSN